MHGLSEMLVEINYKDGGRIVTLIAYCLPSIRSNVSPIIVTLDTVENERFCLRVFCGIVFGALDIAPVSRLSIVS